MWNKNQIETASFLSTYKIQLLIIAVLVLILYGRVIQFGYVGLDDKALILDNYSFIRNLSNIKTAFIHDVFYNPKNSGTQIIYYRPLMTLSLMMDSQFGEQSSKFYHIVNIILHLACCFLLFRFFTLLKYRPDVSFCATILFAIHPILSEAVSWIPGRNDSMLTLFSVASLFCFTRFLETRKTKTFIFHLLFFALALFTKETAIFLPLISWLYYVLIYTKENAHKKFTSGIGSFYILIGYLIIGLVWFLLRGIALAHSAADLSILHLIDLFITNLPMYLQVLQKLIVPYNLSTMSSVADTNFWVGFISIAALIGLLFFSKQKRWNYIIFGFIWFNIFLLPVFFVSIKAGFDHRTYFPLIGFLILVLEIDYFKNLSYKKPGTLTGFVLIVVAYGVLNFVHTSCFANSISFWENAVTNSPESSLAKLNYGYELAGAGRIDEAIKVYNEGIVINPSEHMIHNDLGILYVRKHMYPEAEKEFIEETKVNPTYSRAYYNLGLLYNLLGKENEMRDAWIKAVSVDPANTEAQNALNLYYQGKIQFKR